MPRSQSMTKKRSVRVETEELSIRLVSFRRNYFIARRGTGHATFADDEAILDIDGIIERAARRSARRVDHSISVRLLNSTRYAQNERRDCRFFGSITLRGQQRSALAYLPSEVFWGLPSLFGEGASVIQLTLEPLAGGYGDLVSLYIASPDDPLSLIE